MWVGRFFQKWQSRKLESQTVALLQIYEDVKKESMIVGAEGERQAMDEKLSGCEPIMCSCYAMHQKVENRY